MSQPPPTKKRPLLSHRMRVALALIVIGIAVLFTFLFAPRARDSGNVTGDTLPATITVTNPVATLVVNRSADFNNVHLTVTKVMQAASFSDDPRREGKYTVRVQLIIRGKEGQHGPIGLDYATLARLQLPDGQQIAPKLVAIAPVVLPNQAQSGYIDFPLSRQVDLSSLTLRLGTQAALPFA